MRTLPRRGAHFRISSTDLYVFSTQEKPFSPKELTLFLPAKNLELRNSLDNTRRTSGISRFNVCSAPFTNK